MITLPRETIVMIGCSASKRTDTPAGLASHFYTGELFKLQAKWAMNAGYGLSGYVLSAKYGLLSFGNGIGTYEATLDTAQKRREWNELVISMIRENLTYHGRFGLGESHSLHLPRLTEPCRVIVMAGENYRGWIEQMQEIAPLWTFEVPLAGLGIGEQKAALARMNQQLEEDKREWPPFVGEERWNRSLATIRCGKAEVPQ